MKTLQLLFSALFLSSIFSVTAQAQGTPIPKEELPYQYVEQMPEYNGGSEAFLTMIYDSLTYPTDAAAAKQTGITKVRFIVRPDGTIQDAQTLFKLGYGLDEEAVRIVKLSSGNWKPGSQNGKIVHVALDVTIDFRKKAPFDVAAVEKEQKKAQRKKKN